METPDVSIVEESSSEEEEYFAEKVVGKRINHQEQVNRQSWGRFGRVEYLVKWKGYDDEDNTWIAKTSSKNLKKYKNLK